MEGFPYITLFNFCPNAKFANVSCRSIFVDLQYIWSHQTQCIVFPLFITNFDGYYRIHIEPQTLCCFQKCYSNGIALLLYMLFVTDPK